MGHTAPNFIEKTTKAPSFYTEASLLRAMETAGKHVDDDELRDLMKANGIGRPSTRANIIETLFKRNYTTRRKKQVIPTPMGIQLINTIQNELLKSAELTGQWEKQLKEIEDGEFKAGTFINNMKNMVHKLVLEVRAEKSRVIMAKEVDVPKPIKSANSVENTCPKCTKGTLLKGKSAYGCSQWKEGCDFRVPLVFEGKKLTDNQIFRLIKKGVSTKIKGFVVNGQKAEGTLSLNDAFGLDLNIASNKPSVKENSAPICPKCKKGTLIKGKTAYGCDQWKQGCDFRFEFSAIREKAQGKTLTKELVLAILRA